MINEKTRTEATDDLSYLVYNDFYNTVLIPFYLSEEQNFLKESFLSKISALENTKNLDNVRSPEKLNGFRILFFKTDTSI